MKDPLHGLTFILLLTACFINVNLKKQQQYFY